MWRPTVWTNHEKYIFILSIRIPYLTFFFFTTLKKCANKKFCKKNVQKNIIIYIYIYTGQNNKVSSRWYFLGHTVRYVNA